MEIPNEILSKCRYYHGEEKYPGGESKYHLAFWMGEQFYCHNYSDDNTMIRVVADYRDYFPDDREGEDQIDLFIRASMFAAYFHNFINDPDEYAMAFRSQVIPAYIAGSTSMKI
jgi:hypothetical protein